ncbi:MAG: hypothetical protein QOK29_3215 [Rhodospirillaceae bacterium]|nr:hypothetical protein [Rhodospirillaceae bacterium]
MEITQQSAAARRARLGLILMFLTTACFSCITTFSKLAYAGGSNPETLLLLRMALFGATIPLFGRLTGRPLQPNPRIIRPVLGIALFQIMLSGGYLTAAAFIPVGLAAVLLYTSPFLVALVCVLMARDRMTPGKGITMALAFLGVVIAVGPDFSNLDLRGIAAALTAAMGMVLMITVGGMWMQRDDPLTINVFASLALVVAISVYLLWSGSFHLPATSIGRIGAACATLFYVLGNLCWILSMRLVPPIRMAVIFNLETPLTIASGFLILGERLSLLQVAGAAIVVGAVTALNLLGRRSDDTHNQ